MKKQLFSIALLYMIALPCIACADTIYLKNGHNMEGIIVKDSKNSITLNVGIGTIKLKKTEIDRIEKSNRQEIKKEWNEKYFGRQEFAPPRLKRLAYEFEKLVDARAKAARSLQSKEAFPEKMAELEKQANDLNLKLGRVSEQLGDENERASARQNNAIVREYNILIGKLTAIRTQQDILRSKIQGTDEKMLTYRQALDQFTPIFKEYEALVNTRGSIDEVNYIQHVRQNLKKMGGDFKKHTINYYQYGPHMVITALINDRVSAKLLLDTGASSVMISEAVARRAGISVDKEGVETSLILADGKKIQGHQVTLESVSVGNTRKTHIIAAVAKDPPSDDIDGLLGMSFLEYFTVKINSRRNELILEEFLPPEGVE